MDKQSENHKEEIIKALRKELVSSELRFQKIIIHNSISILIVGQNGIIRFANPAAEYLFHKSKEKLVGQPLGYPMLCDEVAEIIIPSRNSLNLIVEMRVVETVWEEEAVFLVSMRDVTERRNMEEQLRIGEERYRSLVELSPFGIFVHMEGKCVFANSAGIQLLGGKYPEDVIGQSVMRFVHPEYRELVVSRIKSLLTDERQLVPIEEKFIKLDGTPIDVEVSGIKLDYGGKIAVQLVVVDITERKKAEEAIRSLNVELEATVRDRTKQLEIMNSELNAFRFSVSEDSQAPLKAINGFVKALGDRTNQKLDEVEISYLEKIKNAAANINSQIEDLLSLAKITRAELDLHSINLTSLCKEIVNEINQSNSSNDLELNLQTGMSIYADPNLMRIVMNNLLDNAIKFTKHRQYAKIEVGCFTKDGRVIVFVRDNGAGFNMQHAERLFEPFQRFHSSDEFEGSGVGLAFVSRIIDKHNGQIWAESEEGKGSTFYFVVE
ncbi:MAG TPA: PAS domain S-box protein [Leptospiraceae bacterium]|nr:PAS domain S-box protein [Leptospiraceae bacterium]HRG77111.1 PAS domain S-box protein [Leptospiraceae bacterium]